MKWGKKEEKVVKDLLRKNKKASYSKIIELAKKQGINRSKKGICHKNSRDWKIKREVKMVFPQRMGEHNPAWKGGITRTTKGYVLIYAPEHPRAHNRYVFEHILVIEKHLGRYLDKDNEFVHHKNGIKDDNRIENLEVLNSRDHNLTHHPYKIHKKQGLKRGRKGKHGNHLSIHPDIFKILPDEFYIEQKDKKIIIHLENE